MSIIKPKNKTQLKDYIYKRLKDIQQHDTLDLTNVDISNITDLSMLFYTNTSSSFATRLYNFKGLIDISTWDISHVEKMDMFCDITNFKDPDKLLSNWKFTNLKTAANAFAGFTFNTYMDLKFPKLINADSMFMRSEFKQGVSLEMPNAIVLSGLLSSAVIKNKLYLSAKKAMIGNNLFFQSRVFANDTKLDLPKLVDMSYMFDSTAVTPFLNILPEFDNLINPDSNITKENLKEYNKVRKELFAIITTATDRLRKRLTNKNEDDADIFKIGKLTPKEKQRLHINGIDYSYLVSPYDNYFNLYKTSTYFSIAKNLYDNIEDLNEVPMKNFATRIGVYSFDDWKQYMNFIDVSDGKTKRYTDADIFFSSNDSCNNFLQAGSTLGYFLRLMNIAHKFPDRFKSLYRQMLC